MRVYMKGFERPVLVRLARFELVRADWRRYAYDLKQTGEYIANDDNSTTFDVSAVSLQENGNKTPVNYVLPPDIQQQQNVQTTNLVLQNEQALQIRVCNLKDGDSRAIFKNVDLDTRMFNNIKMNVHAEKLNDIPLNDGDLTLFFRVGTDYNNNFYEYEVPLKLTAKGVYDPNSIDDRYAVWTADNEINFKFSDISEVKRLRNEDLGYFSNLNQLSKPYVKDFGGYKISVVGNPNLGTIKSRRQMESDAVEILKEANHKIEELIASPPSDKNQMRAEIQGVMTQLNTIKPGTTAYTESQRLLTLANKRIQQLK